MSKFWLLNTTSYEPGTPAGVKTKLLPGHLIDDAVTPTANIKAAGGVLWPFADVLVTAAAALAQKMSQSQGANEQDMANVMSAAAAGSMQAGAVVGAVQKLVIDLPLATLQAFTSAAAKNIGAALPANARIVDYDINVITKLVGTGPLTAATMIVQNTGETAGALIASTDVFTANGVQKLVGSNPYGSRGGQQLQATITATGGTMAALTAGHLAVDVFYTTTP